MIRATVVLFRAARRANPRRRGAMKNDKEQPDKAKGGEPKQEQGFGELRHYVPAEILNVSFPAAVRGYERHAVDAHIKRVNRLIAEIKVSSSPRMAVRHALEQTEQQVSGLLEQARETADEITTSAHREAETEANGIRAKAADLLVNANAEADATKTATSRTCSRRWNQRTKVKQSRELPTPGRTTRQWRQSRTTRPPTAGLPMRPVESRQSRPAPAELKGAERTSKHSLDLLAAPA